MRADEKQKKRINNNSPNLPNQSFLKRSEKMTDGKPKSFPSNKNRKSKDEKKKPVNPTNSSAYIY